MFITIQTTTGTSLGPYDIYYDAVNPGLLLASNVSSASLAAGVNLTVSNAATSVIVVNTRSGCGNPQQVITLPPSTIPQTYQPVTVRAKLGFDTTLPTTASVYYKIDNSSFFLLGTFSSSLCDTLPSIPIPTNSTLFLGIMSGSDSVAFGATGSDDICTGTSGATNYCGIITPYTLRVTGSQVVSMYAKVISGVIVPCNVPTPPPPPPPPPISNPTVVVKASSIGDLNTRVNFTVTRVRNGNRALIDQQLNTDSLVVGIYDATTTPGIQPNDNIQINLQSAGIPLSGVTLRILAASSPTSPLLVIYRTAGFITADNYTINIPATGNTYYVIEATSS